MKLEKRVPTRDFHFPLSTFLRLLLPLLAVSHVPARAGAPVVHLKLITGADVTGTLLSETDRVVVLDLDGFPCAFSYDQVLPDSAYRTKLAVIRWHRGGRNGVTARDYFLLGNFALRHGRYEVARRDFTSAAKREAQYRSRADRALAEFRTARRSGGNVGHRASDAKSTRGPRVTFPTGQGSGNEPSAVQRQRITDGYKAVGEDIAERLGHPLTLLETPHFLIWTDWARAEHYLLRDWCEQMYAALAERFGLSVESSVFAGKCPIFCMRSRKQFVALAELLDDFDVRGAVGYTSYESNGHVHVVVCRQGGSEAAQDAFAATLVHEGTHAFLHRYRPGHRLPPWISEGFANVVSQSVLGDRCPYAEAAAAVRRQIIQRKHDIGPVFSDDTPLEAHYYPVAQSLVEFLIERDAGGFVRLIDDIKGGVATETALEQRYGLSVDTLKQRWRGE